MVTRTSKTDAALLASIESLNSNLTQTLTAFGHQVESRFTELTASIDNKHAQNRGDIHKHGGVMDTFGHEISELKSRMNSSEQKVFSIIGQGDGGSGALNDLRKGQEELNSKMNTLQSTMQRIEEKTNTAGDGARKATTMEANFRGVWIAILALVAFVTIGGGILTLIMFITRIMSVLPQLPAAH